MAAGIFSVTLEDLKQQADEFGLEGKDRTKFLKEEWPKVQDAKLEKERFEREAEQKRLEREKEMEERRFERELEAKLQSEKLAAQLELERLQLERAKMERENIEARAEVQPAASSQPGQNYVVAVTKTPGLPGFVDGKENLDNYLL